MNCVACVILSCYPSPFCQEAVCLPAQNPEKLGEYLVTPIVRSAFHGAFFVPVYCIPETWHVLSEFAKSRREPGRKEVFTFPQHHLIQKMKVCLLSSTKAFVQQFSPSTSASPAGTDRCAQKSSSQILLLYGT